MDNPPTPSPSDRSLKSESGETAIRAALVHQLYSLSTVTIYGVTVAGIVLTASLWHGVGHELLLSWLLVLLLAQGARFAVASAFVRAAPQGPEAIRWGAWFILGTALTQLWCGLAGILLFPQSSLLLQVLLAAFITIVAATVTVAHAAVTLCYVSSLLVTVLPILGRLFYEGGETDAALGMVGVVYTGALLATGRAAHKMMFDSIRLRLEKDDLVQELQQAGQTLELRIKERTAQLLEVNEQLRREILEREQTEDKLEKSLVTAVRLRSEAEAANMAKGQFLAMMSHEIRTPLNAVIGFSEMMQDGLTGPLNDQQMEFVGYVVEGGRHLLRLLDDILDLSSIDAGRLSLQTSDVHVPAVLYACVSMIKERALRHRLCVEVQIGQDLADARVSADEVRLKQILINLLSNATKFTPDGGKIELEARRDGDDLVISLRDSGIGLLPEDQHRIFEAFEQVQSSYSRPYGGTGLGLALTRKLVESHGGRIWAESAGPGMGSTFHFTIPFKPV
ncbi:MAG: hypothetical protein HY914_02530 [Desulfomonile tiedjei]|nr:hypothetical protein [Desulfomonile tiedjei]